MNMQQIMAQAQKIKRELDKAKKELGEKEFEVSKGGAVKVTVLGNKTIKAVSIDEDAFDKDNKEMVEDMIAMAINEAFNQIDEAEAEINERITGSTGGLGGF